MISKELIKAEVDKVQEKDLEKLYEIIINFEKSSEMDNSELKNTTDITKKDNKIDWQNFVEETYGCLKDDTIERCDQGKLEIRDKIT